MPSENIHIFTLYRYNKYDFLFFFCFYNHPNDIMIHDARIKLLLLTNDYRCEDEYEFLYNNSKEDIIVIIIVYFH